jgi:hypothetical protein
MLLSCASAPTLYGIKIMRVAINQSIVDDLPGTQKWKILPPGFERGQI